MSLLLLVGGARSGKSNLAVRLAERQDAPVLFLATAEARDEDMAERIERHRGERPLDWTTVEEPLELGRTLEAAPSESCVIVDCLTLWVANMLERFDPHEIEEASVVAAVIAASRPGPTVAITNEVGLGVVPVSDLGRRYRDVLGSVNAIWADKAARTLFLVAGQALELARPDRFLDGL